MIRDKIDQCFADIEVHGLPVLTIPPNKTVDYPYLNERFRTGLAAIANSIVQTLSTPRSDTF